MTLDTSNKLIATQLLLEKSDKNMEQAMRIADLGYWDLVANRLYYSVFHAVNAMLLIDGINAGTHKGTSIQFNRSYILTGIFDRKDGMLYGKLQNMRERADYQNTFKLESIEGRNLMESAEELRKRICEYVRFKINSYR